MNEQQEIIITIGQRFFLQDGDKQHYCEIRKKDNEIKLIKFGCR